ncbi:MAG: hypothetical protein ABI612_26350 [Betaproteobacteria bacterium]
MLNGDSSVFLNPQTVTGCLSNVRDQLPPRRSWRDADREVLDTCVQLASPVLSSQRRQYMRNATPILLMATTLWVGPAFAAPDANETYVCLSEASTGFKLNAGTNAWEAVTFSTQQKYIVKRIAGMKKGAGQLTDQPATWHVMKVGFDLSVAQCRDDFSTAGVLSCRGLQDFRFSKKTLRFLTAYFFGYVADGTSHRDTPYLEIGVCDKLQ